MQDTLSTTLSKLSHSIAVTNRPVDGKGEKKKKKRKGKKIYQNIP